MTAAEIAALQSDEILLAMLYTQIGRPVRDGEGNLRSLTDEEREMTSALRAEAKARSLI